MSSSDITNGPSNEKHNRGERAAQEEGQKTNPEGGDLQDLNLTAQLDCFCSCTLGSWLYHERAKCPCSSPERSS
jgi:hypothetical protein